MKLLTSSLNRSYNSANVNIQVITLLMVNYSVRPRNDVIYQAQLLSITGKTAQEIHNVTEQWVLSQPSIVIDGVSYQVDPTCSTEVKELGVTSCNSASESDEGSAFNVTVVVSVIIAVVVLLMILSGLIIASLYYLHKRNSKSKDL